MTKAAHMQKTKLPVWPKGQDAADPAFRDRALEEVFGHIYRQNLWQGTATCSGKGSDLASTIAIRAALPSLLCELGVETLLDAPCGDVLWLARIENLGLRHYIGVDIVAEILAANIAKGLILGAATTTFARLNMTAEPLPAADMVLCRDGLVHMPVRDVASSLVNVRASGARFLLTTTYPAACENLEIDPGWWRPLNLEKAPFALPPPKLAFADGEDGKFLALWRAVDLPPHYPEEEFRLCRRVPLREEGAECILT